MKNVPNDIKNSSILFIIGIKILRFNSLLSLVGKEYKFNMDLPYPMSDKTLKDHFDEMIEKYGEIKLFR